MYAFWHFDDFSWGNTRIVVGEKGQKKAVGPEEGDFDPESIPTKSWSEYEKEMMMDEHVDWEEQSRHTQETVCSCEDEHPHSQCSSVCSSLHSHGDEYSVYSHSNSHFEYDRGDVPDAQQYRRRNYPTNY